MLEYGRLDGNRSIDGCTLTTAHQEDDLVAMMLVFVCPRVSFVVDDVHRERYREVRKK
jgi:hypothetical protein